MSKHKEPRTLVTDARKAAEALHRDKRRIGSTVAALALAGAGVSGLAEQGHAEKDSLLGLRAEVLATVTGIDTSTYTLKEGAALRLTPEGLDDTSFGTTNVAMRVPKGEKMMVTAPMLVGGTEFSDVANPNWRAVTLVDPADPTISSTNERVARTYFFNATALLEQGVAVRTGEVAGVPEGHLPAGIGAKGELVVADVLFTGSEVGSGILVKN